MILTQLTRELVAGDVNKRATEADEVLSALQFLGDIEKEKGNDPFAKELAQFIERTDAATRRSINAADLAMRDGYENIRKPDWNAAMTAFESARSQYQLAENFWQAGIAEFQICYTLTQLRRLPESNQRLIQLKTESDQRKHVWLAALASHLIANNYSLLGHHSNAVGFGAEALKGFASTGDSYWSQNTSNQLTRQYSLIGNEGRAFAIIGGNFDTRNLYYQSRRQTSRNMLTATETMYTFGLYAAARAFADEHLQMSRSIRATAGIFGRASATCSRPTPRPINCNWRKRPWP
jgi:hypothetical protein